MSGKNGTVRPKVVLATLRNKHEGELRAVGRSDLLIQLLKSMGLGSGHKSFLREVLERLADTQEVVVEVNGPIYTLIKLPDATVATGEPVEDTEVSMIAKPGQRRTCSPTDGEGRLLPSTLRPDQVGPVVITRVVPPEVRDAVTAASELVIEQLVKIGKERLAQQDVLVIIRSVLDCLYEENELRLTLCDSVFGLLIENKRLRRIPSGKSRQEQNSVLYEFKLPPKESPALDAATMEQLLGRAEQLKAENAELRKEIERLKAENAELHKKTEGVVDEETLNKLLTRVEEANAKVEDLQRQLEQAAIARDELVQAHKGEIERLKTTAERAQRGLQRQLHEAQEARRTAEADLRKVQSTSKVDPATAARLAKVLGE